jgi:hypothetical protein
MCESICSLNLFPPLWFGISRSRSMVYTFNEISNSRDLPLNVQEETFDLRVERTSLQPSIDKSVNDDPSDELRVKKV